MNRDSLLVPPKRSISLKDYDPADTCGFKNGDDARGKREADILRLRELQDLFYASRARALLVIFQGMDASGKDGAIDHVMSGVNPQGIQVSSFKAPSSEELAHDYLWRHVKVLPERGQIGVFNRSYYEEVVVVRVHPALLERQQLPPSSRHDAIWRERFDDINALERHLVRNGTVIVKFFLHVSKEEQKRRLLDRIDTPAKNWKFSLSDVEERAHWDDYMKAYENLLSHTSSADAPWYIVPADHKWLSRTVVADVLVATLRSLNLQYAVLSDQQQRDLLVARELLKGQG